MKLPFGIGRRSKESQGESPTDSHTEEDVVKITVIKPILSEVHPVFRVGTLRINRMNIHGKIVSTSQEPKTKP